MYLFYCENIFYFFLLLTIRRNVSCVRGKEFCKTFFDAIEIIEKHGGHYTFDWYIIFFATRSLLARSFYPCLYNCTRNIFIHAPMISSASFFFNLKHRINHELSFRVVSEERYASRRNSPARVFTVRLSAPETVAASILLPPSSPLRRSALFS